MAETIKVSAGKAERIVRNLQSIADRFEADGDVAWVQIAAAAALLEGLRLGINEITDGPAPVPATAFLSMAGGCHGTH